MFFLSYLSAELRRRRGRTLVTALGLAVGVGLVATVTALSHGLDDGQDRVLRPLTGVGTDMSVARPITPRDDGFREENETAVKIDNLGEPGEKFTREDFVSSQASFPAREAEKVKQLEGVKATAATLTLERLQVSGEVPERRGGAVNQVGGPPPGPGGPDELDLEQSSITGLDTAQPSLAPVTPERVESGRWFSDGGRREAVVSAGYAKQNGIRVGETIRIKNRPYRVVGLAKQPLGGQSSDIYTRLGELQKLSGRERRVNGIQVRAESSDAVDAVAKRIESSFRGSQVTTARDLAERVSGSLVDAKNLSGKLGTALAAVALLAAFLIAALLTLSSVNKRTRELGTLKAIGWPQRLVVRQVTGESLAQGLLGGLIGAAIGVGGAALIGAVGPELQATVGDAGGSQGAPPGPGPAPVGQTQVESGSSTVSLEAPVDPQLILLAVGLALLGGLLSGAIAGLRAARLRPADALRSVE